MALWHHSQSQVSRAMAAWRSSIFIALFVLAMQPGNSQAQLLAEVKNFLSNLPTFGSSNVPNFSLSNQ